MLQPESMASRCSWPATYYPVVSGCFWVQRLPSDAQRRRLFFSFLSFLVATASHNTAEITYLYCAPSGPWKGRNRHNCSADRLAQANCISSFSVHRSCKRPQTSFNILGLPCTFLSAVTRAKLIDQLVLSSPALFHVLHAVFPAISHSRH